MGLRPSFTLFPAKPAPTSRSLIPAAIPTQTSMSPALRYSRMTWQDCSLPCLQGCPPVISPLFLEVCPPALLRTPILPGRGPSAKGACGSSGRGRRASLPCRPGLPPPDEAQYSRALRPDGPPLKDCRPGPGGRRSLDGGISDSQGGHLHGR